MGRIIEKDIGRLSIQQHSHDDQLMMEKILNRLDKLESESLTKDKDVASLKLTVGELKLTVDTMKTESKLKDADITLLKTSNQQLLKRVVELEESTKRIDKMEEEKEIMKAAKMLTPQVVEKLITEKLEPIKANVSSNEKSL